MELMNKDEPIFLITLEDIQNEAMEKIGRTLTEEEVEVARKGLEFGLLTGIDTVYQTIFSEMIEK
jgi:ribonucleotide reductase beta subunit family protein with ferritin-like domain